MTKKQNGRQASKPQQLQQRRARTNQPSQRMDYSEHHETLCGLTDPFCSAARNARYPDIGAGRSMTQNVVLYGTLSSDANGVAAMHFGNKCSNMYKLLNSSTGNVVTWETNFDGPASTLMTSNGVNYRMITGGIRFSNQLSATNSSGSVVIARGGPIIGTTTTFDPVNFLEWDMYSNKHGESWNAKLKNTTTPWWSLIAQKVAVNHGVNDTTDCLYFFASGLPASTACFTFEIVMNFEYDVKEDNSLAKLAQPQAIYNAPMLAAINETAANHPNSHAGTKEKVAAELRKHAKAALLKHVVPFLEKKAKQGIKTVLA